MSFFKNLAEFFHNLWPNAKPEDAAAPSGFMAFSHTGQVVAAQKALLAAGLAPKIKAPPPALQEGCDMVLEFPLEEQAIYLTVLAEKRIRPLKVMAADGPLTAPESLFRRLDFPAHLMVSAANMKITITRDGGRVVNVSGGGCPDVPALAARLMGSVVTEALDTDEFRSLCSFSLAQAKEEAERLYRAGLEPSGPDRPNDPLGLDRPLPWPRRAPEPLSKPWLIVGTLADPAEDLAEGPFTWQNGRLIWNDREIDPERGTAALMAAYAITAQALGLPPGRAVLAGDDGGGDGSREVYAWLQGQIPQNQYGGLTFHYLYPDADSHGRLFLALDELSPRPLLAADAGFMYVAKLCGLAAEYDLFTPDCGEMAYLADPEAPHPFYTRGALIQREADEDTFRSAYEAGDTAKAMLVKGRSDNIVWRGRVVHRVDGPQAPALEAIGGTGDTATGLASALMAAGYTPIRAAALAAHFNRRAGWTAAPDPGSGIFSVLTGLETYLKQSREMAGRGRIIEGR